MNKSFAEHVWDHITLFIGVGAVLLYTFMGVPSVHGDLRIQFLDRMLGNVLSLLVGVGVGAGASRLMSRKTDPADLQPDDAGASDTADTQAPEDK